ncbi:MAG: glutathione S-transferase family protein [Bauldia sp.]|nr:glutathione S-transferase family protein [Bauldia sp.]
MCILVVRHDIQQIVTNKMFVPGVAGVLPHDAPARQDEKRHLSMALTLYDNSFSPNALRTRAVAYELGLPIELVSIDLRGDERTTDDYLALNPNAKVPTLVDGDFVLWESRAINAYLAGLAPESGLYPHDPRERAIIDQWSYWQAIHLGPAMQKLAMERYFKKKYGFGEPDPAAIEKAEKDVDQFLRVLEDDLKDKDWVAGRLSIVDFAVASTFVFRKEAGISLADFPHVVAWIERVEARPSWRKAIEPIVAAA